MFQDRVTSEENAARFVERARTHREVWGLVSPTGEWAFCPSNEQEGADVIVFWSDRSYAARHVKSEWERYQPRSITFDDFVGRYLKVMHEDKLLVGPNWDAHLCGVELPALELAQRLTQDEKKG